MFGELSYGTGRQLDVVHKIESALAENVTKAGITTATGITAYNLEPTALGLYYDKVPMLAEIPRVISHKGDVATHWKSLTAVDTFNVNMGVEEGRRTGSITPNVVQNFALYATLGKETDYTFEAEEAAESFDNVPERATVGLLAAFRINESKILAYGNSNVPLGVTPTPLVTAGTVAGTLPAATYILRVVALSYDGLQNATVSTGVFSVGTRPNNDGTSTTIQGGSAIASLASGTVTLAAAGSLSATVPAVPAAYGYAWFVGTTAANATIAAITTGNSVTITAPAAGTQLAGSLTTDNSTNPLVFSGLATQFMAPGSGSYYKSLDGAELTSDGAGGLEEFSRGFQYQWDNFKISSDTLVVGGLVKRSINKAIFSSNGPVYRIDLGMGSTGNTAGNDVGYILNPITGGKVKIVVDPYAPAGFAMAYTNQILYDAPNSPRPFELELRMRDYYQIKWPVTTRTTYQGIYYSGVLKVRAPFAGMVFNNIGTANV